MRYGTALALAIIAIGSILSCRDATLAQYAVPNQLTNGQVADATQVMANFNAVLNCLSTVSPAGSTKALQYNAGSGAFGGAGPLADGQLLISATGGVPQPQNLTPGPGITITNAPGSITITSSASGRGLYSQVMSATPTSAGTGLITWLDQGNASVNDSAVGLCISAPSSGNAGNVTGRYIVAPTPPCTITALVAATRSSNSYSGIGIGIGIGIGWYDGSSKLHILSYVTNGGGSPYFEIENGIVLLLSPLSTA